MNIEACQYAAKCFREWAKRWAKDMLPIYQRLELGTHGVMGRTGYEEGPVPTEEQLARVILDNAESFEGVNMRALIDRPEYRNRISMIHHHVLFWVSQDEPNKVYCGMLLELGVIQQSGYLKSTEVTNG